jgi:transposase
VRSNDSPGPDNRSARSLNNEWVTVTNTGRNAVNIGGWTLTEASRHSYRFHSLRLAGHQSVKVHTGTGRNTNSTLLTTLTATCPEMTELARLVGEFADLLTPAEGNDAKLTEWITAVRAADLPHLHSFCHGLELDRAAVNAGLTLPHHNGRTEGVNTRTKRIMRQMHGRAGFDLLRHRILLQ